MKAVCTLIVIADDENARFVVNKGVGKGLAEIAVLGASQFPDDRRAYADRPGRTWPGGGSVAKQGVGSGRTEPDKLFRDRFARRIAETLEQAWTETGAHRMILAAPPKMLGALRDCISGAPAAALLASLPKDLMSVPLHKLASHLDDHLVI